MPKRRVVLSWSSGKDSAWCLQRLRQDPEVELVGLLTTFNAEADRVAMHAVRRELVIRQAALANLPLFAVELSWPCPNGAYERATHEAVAMLKSEYGVEAMAFGDLFLEDIREYRERLFTDADLDTLFPLWGLNTAELATDMIESGLEAVITCVDPAQCPADIVGKAYTKSLLDALPDGVDPCGENGEFHTLVHAGPMFSGSIALVAGERIERDGFAFADFAVATG